MGNAKSFVGALVLMVISSVAVAEAEKTVFDDAALKRKTFNAIDEVVSAGDYPQKCILRYDVFVKTSTKAPTKERLNELEEEVKAKYLKAIADGVEGDALGDVVRKAHRYEEQESKPKTRKYVTATLKYKASGVVNEDIILSIEADVDSQTTLLENMAEVTNEYADRYCSEARPKTEAGKTQKNVPAKSQNSNSAVK